MGYSETSILVALELSWLTLHRCGSFQRGSCSRSLKTIPSICGRG